MSEIKSQNSARFQTESAHRQASLKTRDRELDLKNCTFVKNHQALSLYIHYPFCKRLCPYCDFFSVVKGSGRDEEYASLLLAEFELYKPFLDKTPGQQQLKTVFLGGGTPSLMSPKALVRVFEQIRPYLADDAEITAEANPGTITKEWVAALKASGINRVSLGAQSFDDEKLKALGRIHKSDDISRALELLGTDFRVNLDVMRALPNQTLDEALSDLKKAIATGVEHLSWYELTLEVNTPFYDNPPHILLSDDEKADLDDLGNALLQEAGYSHYEVSAYTKGRRCAHNLNYWKFGDYIGLGAGASGKLTTEAGIFRTANLEDPFSYLDKDQELLRFSYQDNSDDILLDWALNRPRVFDPISFKELEEAVRIKRDHPLLMPRLKEAEEDGLIMLNDEGFTLTYKGRMLLSEFMGLFLTAED